MRSHGVLWLLLLAVTSPAAAQTTIRIIDRDSVPIPYALVSVGKGEPRATERSAR